MKVNLKTTNEAENAAETPTCHQMGQRTVNGIIGNTRRGIVIDKTLDPDSNNPVANKPVSTALAALAGQLAKGQVVFLDQLPESGEPHKVYVLTATNQRYWWDGNAFVKIVPTDIKDSATIKHTLAENKISLDLDEAVKGKIDSALQKPTGLTKTKLVGVGAQGQENIEIGDNLTLENGKLSVSGGGSGGGGIATANISSETFQLDTSSLTNKDQYVLARLDEGEGNISYIPLQTYFLSDGYSNKEVSLQISNHDFRLSLTNVSFSSVDNYTLKGENTNIDFTNTLDSNYTWTKLGDVKYITIEELNLLTGESSHKYLEISGGSGVSSSPLELDGGRIQYISNHRYFPPINLTKEQVETIRTKYANKEPFLIKLKYEDTSTGDYFIEFNAQNLSAYIESNGNNELGNLYTLIVFDSPNPLSFLVEIDLYGKSIRVNEKSFLYLDSTRVDVNLNVKNALQLQYVRNGAWAPVSDYAIYFDEINGKPIIHSDSTVNKYNIPTITFED